MSVVVAIGEAYVGTLLAAGTLVAAGLYAKRRAIAAMRSRVQRPMTARERDDAR